MERKERTILVAILANLVLIVLRFLLAGLSGSLGLEANAWHSLADIAVSIVVWIGFFLGRQTWSARNQMVVKLESIVSLVVACFIFYMGIEILSESLSSDGTELRNLPWTVAGSLIGVLINYFMARFKIFVGEQTGSPSLIADGYHSKMDMYCAIAVLVGLSGSLVGLVGLEKITAIVATVFIFVAAFEIFTKNLKTLVKGEDTGQQEPPKQSKLFRKKTLLWGVLVAFLGYGLSGLYSVSWDEEAMVLRFGVVASTGIGPGVHYRMPAPFEKVVIVKKETVRSISTEPSLLLTGDANLVQSSISVHYRVNLAENYALRLGNPEALVRFAAMTGLRQVVGRKQIDALLADGKESVEQDALKSLQAVLDRNSSGIEVLSVQLVAMTPPEDTVASFQDLASARQDRNTFINEAEAYRNTIVPEARGKSFEMERSAEAYAIEKVNVAGGDGELFLKRQAEYKRTKGVTEYRLYMESLDKVLPNVRKVLVGGNVKVRGTEVWLLGDKSSDSLIGRLGGNQ